MHDDTKRRHSLHLKPHFISNRPDPPTTFEFCILALSVTLW